MADKGSYIVLFKSEVENSRIDEILAGLEGVKVKHRYNLGDFKGFAATLTDAQLEAITKLDEVKLFEADGEVTAFAQNNPKIKK